MLGSAVGPLLPTHRLAEAVDPLRQARFTSYRPSLVCAGMSTSAVSILTNGSKVAVPNALEVTVAGTLLSPQSARNATNEPASTVSGVTSIDTPAALAAGLLAGARPAQ